MAVPIDQNDATANLGGRWPKVQTPVSRAQLSMTLVGKEAKGAARFAPPTLNDFEDCNSVTDLAVSKKQSLWLGRVAAMLIAAAAFGGTFFLGSRHNTFPYGFHPDEPSKAEQILSTTGYRNFLHPQLMLEVTQRVLNWSRTPRDIQRTTELGRTVSTVFAAIGVTAICITGYLNGGLWGAFLLGISCTLCASLTVCAHYFKEDTALIMGLGLVLLATHRVMTARSRLGAAISITFLALACAVAASGKYVGAVFLIAGLAAVIAAPLQSRRKRIGRALWLVALVAGFTAAINYRALIHPSAFRHGFDSEAKHAVTDHFGLTMSFPNSYFVENLPVEAGWPMIFLAALAILTLLITWRLRSGWDVLSLLIGPGYLLILSFSTLAATRYLLPTVMMMHITVALSALWLIQLARKAACCIVGGIVFAALIASINLPRCVSVVHQFGDDSRDRLRAWLIANVPPQMLVVGDFYAGMVVHAEGMRGEDTIGNGIVVREVYDASSFGPLSSFTSQGISYVVVSDCIYERYFTPQLYPTSEHRQDFEEQRRWYLNLLLNHSPVWKYDPPMNLHDATNPALRLYRIDGH
jgi:hypothetical protein